MLVFLCSSCRFALLAFIIPTSLWCYDPLRTEQVSGGNVPPYYRISSKAQIRFVPSWQLVTGVYLQRTVPLQSPSTSLHCTAAFISNCAGIKEPDLANKSWYARCHHGCASGTGTSFSSCTSRGTSGNEATPAMGANEDLEARGYLWGRPSAERRNLTISTSWR